MKLILAITTFLAFITPVNAANSIVGTWDFRDQNCESPIHITAMSLKSEDVKCQFKSVKRQGNKVTWTGHCDDAEGGSTETVVAKLNKNGELTIKYIRGGNLLENLKRCKATS